MIENYAEGIVGIWVLLSPWLLGFPEISLAKWSNVICGLFLILVNMWSLFGEKKEKVNQ